MSTATYCNVLVSPLDGSLLPPTDYLADADALLYLLDSIEDVPPYQCSPPKPVCSPFTLFDVNGARWLLTSQGAKGLDQIPDAHRYYASYSSLSVVMQHVCSWPAKAYPDAPCAEAFEGRDEGLAYLFSFVGRPHMVPQRKYQRYFLSLSAVYGAILDAARLVVDDSAIASVSEAERHRAFYRLNLRIDGGARLALEFGREWSQECLASTKHEFEKAARNWVTCQGAVLPVVRRAADELRRAAGRLGMHSSPEVVRDAMHTIIGDDYHVEGWLGQAIKWYARVPAYGSQSRCDEVFVAGMQSLVADDREEVFPYVADVDSFVWTILTDAFVANVPTTEQLLFCEKVICDIHHMASSLRILGCNTQSELVLPVLFDAPTMLDFMSDGGLDGLSHFRMACTCLMTDGVRSYLTELERSQYDDFLMGTTPPSVERWTIIRMMTMCLQSLHIALSSAIRSVRANAVARWADVSTETKHDKLADAVAAAVASATAVEQALLPDGVQLSQAVALVKFIPVTRAGVLKALDHCGSEAFMRDRDSLPFVMTLFIDQVRVEAMLRMPGETPEVFECYIDRIIVIRRRLEMLARVQCIAEDMQVRFKEILEDPEWIQMVVTAAGVNPLAVSAYNRFGKDIATALIYTPDTGMEAIRVRVETTLLIACKSAGTDVYMPDLLHMNGLDGLCSVYPVLSQSVDQMVQVCTAVNAVYGGMLVPLIYNAIDGACQRKRPHVEVTRLEEPTKRARLA